MAYRWFFNPFAWQIVFVSAAVWGSTNARFPTWLSRSGTALVLAIAVVEIAFVGMTVYGRGALPFVGKVSLGPLRLLHFASVATLAIRVLPTTGHPFWESLAVRPLAVCGRNSLATYCVGGLISTVGTVALGRVTRGRPGLAVAFVNVAAVTCACISATAWGMIMTRRAT